MLLLLSILVLDPQPREEPLAVAKGAAVWLRSVALDTPDGCSWPASPTYPDTVWGSLYYGAPGLVLFFGELGSITGDSSWFADARVGAEYLLKTMPEEVVGSEASLYMGMAGQVFALNELARNTGEDRWRVAAKKGLNILIEAAQWQDDRATYGPVTDILEGDAGVGLFLLYAVKRFEEPKALQVAQGLGRHLLALGIAEHGGKRWATKPGMKYEMPNFSHGTAGIAFFLAELGRVTGNEAFIKGAEDGAAYLAAINKDGLVHCYKPGGEELYYLNWCHGPAGTGRLFQALSKASGKEPHKMLTASVGALLGSGIPEKRTPGFWNNVGICCGSAGVGMFLLGVQDQYPKTKELIDHLEREIASKAKPEINGLKWIHAEHRREPENLLAQTGYMQGAAGIGLYFLRLHAHKNGLPWRLTFPDDPFASDN